MVEQKSRPMLEDNPEGEHPHCLHDEHSVGTQDGNEAEEFIPDDEKEGEGLIFIPEDTIVSE